MTTPTPTWLDALEPIDRQRVEHGPAMITAALEAGRLYVVPVEFRGETVPAIMVDMGHSDDVPEDLVAISPVAILIPYAWDALVDAGAKDIVGKIPASPEKFRDMEESRDA